MTGSMPGSMPGSVPVPMTANTTLSPGPAPAQASVNIPTPDNLVNISDVISTISSDISAKKPNIPPAFKETYMLAPIRSGILSTFTVNDNRIIMNDKTRRVLGAAITAIQSYFNNHKSPPFVVSDINSDVLTAMSTANNM